MKTTIWSVHEPLLSKYKIKVKYPYVLVPEISAVNRMACAPG